MTHNNIECDTTNMIDGYNSRYNSFKNFSIKNLKMALDFLNHIFKKCNIDNVAIITGVSQINEIEISKEYCKNTFFKFDIYLFNTTFKVSVPSVPESQYNNTEDVIIVHVIDSVYATFKFGENNEKLIEILNDINNMRIIDHKDFKCVMDDIFSINNSII